LSEAEAVKLLDDWFFNCSRSGGLVVNSLAVNRRSFGVRYSFFLALTLQRFDDSMLPAAGRKNVK
jgi:hypothetical protein